MNATDASLEPLVQRPDTFVAGQVFRETRPNVISKIEDRIARVNRRKGKTACAFPKRHYLRVLGIVSGQVVVISTEDPVAQEQFLPWEQAEAIMESGGWRLTDVEPIGVLRLCEEDLSERQLLRMRENQALIQPLIDLDFEALIPEVRWPLVKAIAAEHGVDPAHVFRVFRRYLQGGMNPQVLAGRWFRRTRGVGLGSRVDMAAENKIVRKAAGRKRNDGNRAFIVTNLDVQKIIAGGRKYYFKGPFAGNWRSAWKLFVAEDYLDLDPVDGKIDDAALAPFRPGSYPSYRQFRYWVKLDEDFEQLYRKLVGDRPFELLMRRRRKKSASTVRGPGHVFFIDATPLDWIIVHPITRLPLEGKAKLYLIVDVFSHLIVGYYLHVGAESYDGVSLALLAAAEDKTELGKRFGMDIPKGAWPSACLCTFLSSDGAGATYKQGVLVRKKIIRGLTIVPAWRPDLKGLIEALNAAFAKFAERVPGHSNGRKERGEDNPNAHACLDLQESNRLIISKILQTNSRLMTEYPLSEDMIADRVVASPIQIWNWGCSNRSGLRKLWPQQALMKLCLPIGKAKMTRDGVKYGPMLYEAMPGTLPRFQDQCARAAATGSWSVKVSYHPSRFADFWLHEGDELVKLQLTPKSQDFATWGVIDLDGHKASQGNLNSAYQEKNEVYDIAREWEQQKIIEAGMKKTEAARGPLSERRREKSDRAATTADAKRIEAAHGLAAPPASSTESVSTTLLDEEEADIVRRMGGAA